MDFTEVLNTRRTSREWLKKDVEQGKIQRILEAAYKVPTWNHNLDWHFIILHSEGEKEKILDYAKKVSDKFDAEKYLNVPRPYPVTLGQKMYAHAMPRQYSMLKDASYILIPVFRMKEVSGGNFSRLNTFATIWCSIENIFLAASNEGLSCSMRIPCNEEHEVAKKKLKVPTTYQMPCFIGVGYADPGETKLEEKAPDFEKQLHFGGWR